MRFSALFPNYFNLFQFLQNPNFCVTAAAVVACFPSGKNVFPVLFPNCAAVNLCPPTHTDKHCLTGQHPHCVCWVKTADSFPSRSPGDFAECSSRGSSFTINFSFETNFADFWKTLALNTFSSWHFFSWIFLFRFLFVWTLLEFRKLVFSAQIYYALAEFRGFCFRNDPRDTTRWKKLNLLTQE